MLYTEDHLDAFPVNVVPRNEYKRPEIKLAIEAEISKFKSFQAKMMDGKVYPQDGS